MKIEQALVQYLLKFKKLPLQGIGLFELQGAVQENSDGNRPVTIPEGAITFTQLSIYNEDASLVEFVSELTGKIKPLASADLDSYLILGRQFINLGNPFIIPGIGSLEKNNQGNLIFKPGLWVADRIESSTKQDIESEEVVQQEETLFNDYKTEKKSNSGKTVLIAVSLLIIALIGWAVWRFAFVENEPDVMNTTVPATADSAPPAAVNTSGDSVLPSNVSQQPLSGGFRIIVNEYNNFDRATKRYNDLISYGRNVVLYTKDSVNYLIAEQFDSPLADTANAQQSLREYYGPGTRTIDY